MTKRYEKITIGEKTFTLDTKETVKYRPIMDVELSDVYARPSTTKISIYHSWCNWFIHQGGFCSVRSHNCNFFTLEGYIYGEDGQQYYTVITPANNYCWKVTE